jgi:16S rRNA (cytosine1402-N4)-methyltransferase
MKTGNFEGEEKKDFYGNSETPFRIINRKGTTPGDEEITANNRSRSARLRIAEKI